MLPSRLPTKTQALSVLPAAPTREQLEQFGHLLQSLEPEHGVVDISTMHHHADKLYGRSVVIKAGTYLVGLPHKAGHINVASGDITIWGEGTRRRVTGLHLIVSEAGAMRVGYAHRDTTWLSVHANLTGSNDPDTIEDALVEHPERLMSRRAARTLVAA